MQENSKDPAIKLFGKKIPFPGEAENHFIAGDETPLPPSPTAVIEVEDEEREVGETETAESDEEKEIGDKDPQGEKVIEKKKEADDPFPNAAETKNNNNNSSIQNPNTPSIEEKPAKSKNAKSESKQQSDSTTNNLQEKTLKKPDKLLPCPRCKSMETKFCYYNNYNVNQPRYFCRACQRYWTAGGTMRNVPVGAGRRKNKNCSLHYRHITISKALQAATIDSPNGTTNHLHFPCLTSNGRVLSFGNEFHSIEETKIQSKGENVEDCSTLSSITVSNSIEESGVNASKELLQQRNNGFLPQVQNMSSVPWSYPWSSAVPMSFYPTPFWNVPWFPSHPFGPNPISSSSGGSNSPTLGKHSREDDDDDMVKRDDMRKEDSPRQRNGCVLVPKTLRIDDPNEAAKSSIWATLGIKNECMSKRGMINAFQSKKGEKNHVVQTSPMLMANPAALSRSLNFHENS